MKAGCLTEKLLKIDAGGGGLTYIAVGSLSIYGTTIRSCGVVDTIYQVVNSTCESIVVLF